MVLFILSLLLLSSSTVVTSGLVVRSHDAMHNINNSGSLQGPYMFSVNRRNSLIDANDELKPGYYRVYDVYPSGEKVLRGTAPFGTPIQPRVTEEEYSNPLGSKYFWIIPSQGVFLYFGPLSDGTYQTMTVTTKNDVNKVNVTNTWERNLGPYSLVTKIDYKSNAIDDLVLPRPDASPIVVNGSSLKKLKTIPRSTSTEGIYAVASGDVDGDGLSELVFACCDYSGYSKLYLRIVDDWNASFEEIKKIDIKPLTSGEGLDIYDCKITLQDIDGDGRAEILFTVVSFSVTYGRYCYAFVFDDGKNEFKLISDLSDEFKVMYENYISNIVAGNFTGATSTEIVVTFDKIYLFRYDKASHTIDFVDKYLYMPGEAVIKGDVNGDGLDELIVGSTDFYSVTQTARDSMSIYIYTLPIKSEDEAKIVSWEPLVDIGTFTSSPLSLFVKLGLVNLDGDDLPEIAVAYVYEGDKPVTNDHVRVGEITFLDDANTSYKVKAQKYWKLDETALDTNLILQPMALSAKMLLEYTGIHNQSMSQPYIMAVMAAPPTIKGIGQNYMASETLFGTAVSKTTSETNGYTVSTGITLSFEQEGVFNLFKVSASVKFTASLEKTHTVTQTIQECREFAGDYNSDYVIFETVMYDNYYYKILLHPNSNYVGQLIAISVPNTPTVYKWTVDFFNKNNRNYPDIGNETFNHTIGKVWTYPTLDDVHHLEELYGTTGFWKSSKTMAVGAGQGVNSIEIDLEKEKTTETTTTFGVEFESGFAVAGVGMSVSTGLSTSFAYSVTVGKTTKYRGDVGDIAPSYYNDYKYSFGLFVYNLYRKQDHLAYQVVNYWVEDYNGPHSVDNNPMSNVINSNPVLSDTFYKLSVATGLSIENLVIAFIASGIVGITAFTLGIRKLRGKKKKHTKHSKKRRRKK